MFEVNHRLNMGNKCYLDWEIYWDQSCYGNIQNVNCTWNTY
jgi:hypothetical protein